MSKRGFTLIEVLLVIGLIAILAAIVIIAINPARQFAQARNTQRSGNVNAILNAVHQNMIDNSGIFTCDVDGSGTIEPNGADGIPTTTAANMGSGATDFDICGCLVDRYLAEMPYDPVTGSYTDCTTYDTGYTILQSTANNRITVAAPAAELGETIDVTR